VYTFLATCTDLSGRDVVERVEAESLKHARELLEQRGFTNVVFDLDSELYQGRSRFDGPSPFTPEEDLRFRRAGAISWSLWLRVWARNLAPFLAWNAASWWQGPPYGWLDALGFVMTACVMIAAFVLGLPMHLYESLDAASAWSRWDRVLRLAPIAEALGRILRFRMLEVDARFRRARALVGVGRAQEAFALVAGLTRPETELGRVADLHWSAGDRERALALRRRTTEAAPNKADVWIDYALTLMRAGDFDAARRALDRGRSCELTALARCFVGFADGVLTFEAGGAMRAVELLHQAIDGLAALSSSAGSEACGLWWKGYLVLALAAARRTEEARRTFADCRALLESNADHRELLERCRRATG
jgi:tetratricopeptide (TPR) repeat protein